MFSQPGRHAEDSVTRNMSRSLATAYDTQMILGGNRNISGHCDMQMNRGTCCSLVTRMVSHPGRHAEDSVTRNMSPSLATA